MTLRAIVLKNLSRPSILSFRHSLVGLGLACFSLGAHAEVLPGSPEVLEMGRRIYMEGILPSGNPLQGKRMGDVQVEGAAAACEVCHRRSGMGSLEGNIVVPPITGRFLMANDDNRPTALLDQRAPKNVTRAHAPYTAETFAKALRQGVNINQKAMNALMPKYDLSDQENKAIMAYLRQLSSEVSPGVEEDTVHFATIVTPEVSKAQREVLTGMMRKVFNQRNASQQTYSGRMRMPLDLLPRTLRNWELSVWELTGAPETWAGQLAEHYQRQPVFAVVSGISNSTWAPVDAFCQQQKIPCLLPSIALSPEKTAFYPLYYSRGVALEADVLAKHLRSQDKPSVKRIIQIYKDDEVGRGAVQALTKAMQDSGVSIETRVFSADMAANKALLKDSTEQDAVMMWLRPEDLKALHQLSPKLSAASLWVSGFLANENYGFATKDWQKQLKVIYPYELGKTREKNAAAMKSWLRTWKLPLVDEMMQTEVFFDLLFLTDLSSQMLDNLYRDYFVERAEDMLSYGSNSSAYPNLSLSRGQRFASKGAYIAHVDQKGKLVAESEWIVP
jgi:cytochrome c553